ncbi:MAG: threonine--tRNA ligase [Candidatus Kapaibacteriales bacterium]
MVITLPDGSKREYGGSKSARDVAESISGGLARAALVAETNGGRKIEMNTLLEGDAFLKFYTWDSDEGKEAFWHSSAHLLAEALQELYPGVKFGIGPAIESGFYYDVDLPEGQSISSNDFEKIEKKMKELAKKKSEFNMNSISWEDALDYYKNAGNEYKVELIENLKGQPISFCKHGGFTDLCRGGHIPNTGLIKAIKIMSVASAYWRGDSDNKMLTRIYGITFPKQSMLDEFIQLREEAEKRDHRKLGKELKLFMQTPEVGQGLPIWLPKGTYIRRKLERFITGELLARGYQEVITPHIGNLELYKTSGHYPYYKDSQFSPIEVDDEYYMLKPMNCPHHHKIYESEPRSYRDLPIRLAEFGTVYRYEQSGELNGFTRVRCFTQDDAHIYCTEDQLRDEIKNCVELTQLVFNTFGMDVTTRLSFKDDNPEKYAGNNENWEKSQKIINEVADELGIDYFIGEGEASFYGPKIDFIVKDTLGRKWQLGTVQVDYVMPERFDLDYTGADNSKHRPVIIHRAPFGSMERFISILIEHFAGNFPVWLAPVQVSVLPISDKHIEYAGEVMAKLKDVGIRAEVDTRVEKVNRKIAESEQAKIPYAFIIGDKEVEAGAVSVREHQVGQRGSMALDDIIREITQREEEKTNHTLEHGDEK